MEKYAAAKAKLFEGVGAAAPRVAVINADDAAAGQMIAAAKDCEVVTYGVDSGDWQASGVTLRAGATTFHLQTPHGEVAVQSPLTGRVNVYNLLAAGCAALARGLSLSEIAEAAKALHQVPGRFEVVPGSQAVGFSIVVDYAHTDDALKNLIELARDLTKQSCGRVITMFGCGGDRDRTKRPKMGRVAATGSDLVVVTSDNPRSEDPMRIIDEVMVGVRETSVEYVIEVDRRAAIDLAIRAAKLGDIVLLAGKGHEKTQTFADRTVPFDDVAEAAKVLASLKVEEHK
jgi:UDP-N-acetylmuramoyl-L-alanyl-D-glutamate--2,6-diaminopimelate ligase